MAARPKLLILDANALLHRAWHALPPLTSPEGKVVNAAYGMASVVLKLTKDEKPAAFIACWDTEAPTFRHEAYKEYKATRKEQPDELYDQVPIAKEVLETLGVKSIELDGYEADDLLGTLAVRAVKEGYDARIVTGDRDALQLIAPHIDVLTFKKGVSETKLFTDKEFEEEYGIKVAQFIDWKALRGDSSDNIPGVRGIGEKTATELLLKFKTLDGIFKAAHNPKSDLSDGVRKKLIEGEKSGRLALTLVGIDLNVPLKVKLADLTSSLDREAFIQTAAKYGFRSLIIRLPKEAGGAEPPASSRVATKRTASPKKKSDSEVLQLSSEADVMSFLADVRCVDEISLVIASQAQESLFGGNSSQSIVIGLADKTGIIPSSLLSAKEIRRELADVLSSERIGKVSHDAKRVMKELEALKLDLRGIAHDTLIAAYLLAAGERSLDLETLVLQITGKPLPEGDARPAAEAQAIRVIAKTQREQMKEIGADRVWERFEKPLIPVLRDMERVGILIDVSYLKKLSKEMTEDKQNLEKKMEKLVGHPFNPASPSQLAVILFDEFKLSTKGIKSGKTGFSTAASELEKLQGQHPLIDFIFEHRELAKLLSTYVDTLPMQTDSEGRVHTTFGQAVAATGRLSSSDPNLQNIPIRTEAGRRIRRAFIASPGMELLSCDYSQIELRVVAALSKDEKMLAAFNSGLDIHTATAAAIWKVAPNEVTKDQRRAAKAVNFGIIYGQGPQGLARSAGIPFAEAKEFIAAYFDTYRGIKEYLDSTKAKAHELGYVETLFGRRRPIPDINSGMPQLRAAAERMAINMPVQGTATGDLVKLALIRLAQELPKISADARMLLQVHDEILLEVPQKDVKKVAAAVRDIMENIEKIGVPIVVDAKKGKNWEEMEKM
jgi:DNA polymerase-1